MIRLDKYLCEMEAGTRSEVKAFIKKGRVTVNGETAKSPEQKVDETKDTVTLDGHSFSYQKYFYYMLHKPAPVGRLDKDTEGLLLITNDGALAHRLLSPVKHVPKTYLVHTKKPVTSQMCEKLEAGVEIGDETPTAPAKTKLLSDTDCGLLLTITEGRFHQVKRMLQAVGNEVVYLKRLSMGALVLDETLSKGSWRALTEEEKAQLGV